MTRDESLQIVGMIISGWPSGKEWEREEIDIFARSIQDLDAELATHVVLKAVKETQYRPSVAEIRERVRNEKRKLAPVVAPLGEPKGRPVPLWVKRWICARMLYEAFGKERDERRFVEQGDYGDLTKEVMPEGAWVEEANALTDEQLDKAFRISMR